jgi:hypothetical protein
VTGLGVRAASGEGQCAPAARGWHFQGSLDSTLRPAQE